MGKIVPGGEDEQASQDGEAGSEAIFLGALRQRPATQRLGR